MSHLHCCHTTINTSSFGSTDIFLGEWKINTNRIVYLMETMVSLFLKDNSVNRHNQVMVITLRFQVAHLQKQKIALVMYFFLNGLDTGWTNDNTDLGSNGNNNTMNTSGAGDYGLRGTLKGNGKYYMEFNTIILKQQLVQIL